MWYGVCTKEGKIKNCSYNETAKALDSDGQRLLSKYCPHLVHGINKTFTCCDNEQVIRKLIQSISNCPHSYVRMTTSHGRVCSICISHVNWTNIFDALCRQKSFKALHWKQYWFKFISLSVGCVRIRMATAPADFKIKLILFVWRISHFFLHEWNTSLQLPIDPVDLSLN